MLVGTAGRQQNVVVQYQVITGSVAHQLITVSVQYISSGRLHTGDGGKGGGIVDDTAGLNDLQVVHFKNEEDQKQQKNQQDQHCPETAYSFHNSPPIDPMALARG